jgi:hypothetical protein
MFLQLFLDFWARLMTALSGMITRHGSQIPSRLSFNTATYEFAEYPCFLASKSPYNVCFGTVEAQPYIITLPRVTVGLGLSDGLDGTKPFDQWEWLGCPGAG